MKEQCCEERDSGLLDMSLDALLDRLALCPIFSYWVIKTEQINVMRVQ